MDAEITALEGKLSKAREVKQGMMSVLLGGKYDYWKVESGELKVETLNDMNAKISALEGKLSMIREVKAGMMSVLLSGKIRLVGSG